MEEEPNVVVVLYPSPCMGHLISMVELGKLIISNNNQASTSSVTVTILVYAPPFNTGSISSYISQVSTEFPSISFHHLPTIPASNFDKSSSFEDIAFALPRLLNPHVRQAIGTTIIDAFIIDFFNDAVFEVANDLNIPIYYFYTSCASTLCSFLYLPALQKSIVKDEDVLLRVPGGPPFRSSCLPSVFQDPHSKASRSFINCSINMSKSNGIIVNTVESFELRSVKAIRNGLCVPNGNTTPPIFCIGPLIDYKQQQQKQDSEAECLKWLSSHPSRSVVFLCFGSFGSFSSNQLTEIATAIERSGHRFLWVVRSSSQGENRQSIMAEPEPNLDELLPKGFQERTKNRCLVVKSWVPQVAVLNHESVGGFVTHCGWNSVLEALCGGVPMIAWPLYAEQRLLAVFMEQQMNVALPLKKENGDGEFVSAVELEERVSELMGSTEKGREVRERVCKMRDEALMAMKKGCSSHVALTKLTGLWRPSS